MGKTLLRFLLIAVVVVVGAAGLVLALLLPATSRTGPAGKAQETTEVQTQISPQSAVPAAVQTTAATDYVMALTTADKFMQAWSTRQAEAGYALLTDRLKQSGTREEILLGISGVSNPHHQAYEIADGRQVDKDTFEFSVWPYEYYTGEQVRAAARPAPLTIGLKRLSGFEWQVDRLPGATAATAGVQPLKYPDAPVDTDYIMALTTADRFMQAWSSRDAQGGYSLLTEQLQKSRDKADLMQAISGLSNPHHQAYEIADGRRADRDTFQFSVWTYEWYTGEQVPAAARPKPRTITLRLQSDGQWLVDQLP